MIVYGKQVCRYLIARHPGLIERFLLAKTLSKTDFSQIAGLGKPIERIDAKRAQALARGRNHQGWFCEIRPYRYSDVSALLKSDFLVVLAGVTDVGNIGAIVRTAYALGVEGLIVSGIGQLPSEAVVRASSGAMFDLPVAIAPNLLDLLNEVKMAGFTTYGADMDGTSIDEVHIVQKRMLVLGSEGEGLTKRACSRMDHLVKIPMANPFDSLNVNAAAAILIDRMRHA